MNIVQLIRKSDGAVFQGFLDWDPMSRKMNFYYYSDTLDGWTSAPLGEFKPVQIQKTVVDENPLGNRPLIKD